MRTKKLFPLMFAVVLLACASCSGDEDAPYAGLPPVNPDMDQSVAGRYAIGDCYSRGSVTGLVYEISDDGSHGKVVSLVENDGIPWAPVYVKVDASDLNDGRNNMKGVSEIPGWKEKFPAFGWCADLNPNGNDGWYLPSINELTALYRAYNGGSVKGIDLQARADFNRRLTELGGTPITEILDHGFAWATYWSSTYYRPFSVDDDFDVYVRDFTEYVSGHHYGSKDLCRVRAIFAF